MLKFLDMNKFVKGLFPVTSPDLFSKSNEFNQDGLYSERIFGNLESSDRREKYSYIELHTKVVHPSALKIILQLNRKIESFLSASETFNLDSKGNLVPDPDGFTGISKFIEIFPNIKFRGETETREKFIELLTKAYKENTLFVEYVPVIPPDFRPAYQDEDGNWVVDKINDIYQSIIRKAVQVRSSGTSGVLFDLLSYGLQLAVVEHDVYIRSKIEKKNGLIRNQMLGKRIDFSGRAVITPGPNLKINEVGVPFRIAAVIFEPFLIYRLLYSGLVNKEELSIEIEKYLKAELSVDSVRRLIKAIKAGDKLPPKLYKILRDNTEVVMKDRVVICKRDPVLHAESVRGFKPILVEGDTLQICTLQVGGFNADFDGDQMAIYTPLTDEAQEEVKNRMMNLESSESSKSLVFSLNKEMYVGLYIMTKNISHNRSPIAVSQQDLDNAVDPYIPVKYRGKNTTMGKAIFNSALPENFPFVEDIVNKKVVNSVISKLVEKKYDKKIIIDSISKISHMGFKFATIMAPNITLDNIEVPDRIYELKNKLESADTETAANIIDEMSNIIEKHLEGTGLYDLIVSGAGKGWTQPIQIFGAKGVVTDTKGNVLEPVKSSFAEGLTTTEFFRVSPGARKGLADRVLNTATTGYMSRKLSYVLNPVEADLYLKDCKTNRPLTIKLDNDIMKRLSGRYIIEKNQVVPFKIEEHQPGEVIKLRTPIYCTSPKVCHMCYGDLLRRHRTPFIGILAAQMLGEVNTQAIMRSFHTGGVVKVKKKEILSDIISNDPLIPFGVSGLGKYLYQSENLLNTSLDCTLTIDLIDYDLDDTILVNEEEKTIWVKNLISKIDFEDLEFNIILDYPVILQAQNMKKFGKDQIRINFSRNSNILEVSMELEDIKKQVSFVERLMSGKEIFKDVDHFLLKLYRAFRDVSGMDLVHLEVLISNALRNKNDLSKPARLGTWNPVLINMKDIVFRSGFVQGLAFENIGKSINTGLISDVYDQPSILEKVLTGTIVTEKKK